MDAHELLDSAVVDDRAGAARLPMGFWWAAGSIATMAVGAFGPWETVLGIFTYRGTGDGPGWKVVGAAGVAAVALVAFVRWRRRWLCVVPLAAGGLGVAITAYNIHAISTFGADEIDRAEWGIYAALAGSCSLVLASLVLAIKTKRRGRAKRRPIPGSHATAKVRNPWAVFVYATFTFGLYYLYWYYQANRELKEFGIGRRPVVSLLAQFPGALLLAPPIVSWWRFYGRLREAEDRAGSPDRVDHTLGIVLYVIAFFLLPFELVYAQQHLNSLWETAGGSTPGAEPLASLENYAPEPQTASMA